MSTLKVCKLDRFDRKVAGRDYDLCIHPAGDLKSGKKYPVLYLLDGQWYFKLLDSVLGLEITKRETSPGANKLSIVNYQLSIIFSDQSSFYNGQIVNS